MLTPKQARALLTKRKRDLRKALKTYGKTLSKFQKLQVTVRDQGELADDCRRWVNHAEAAVVEAKAYAKAHRPKRKKAVKRRA